MLWVKIPRVHIEKNPTHNQITPELLSFDSSTTVFSNSGSESTDCSPSIVYVVEGKTPPDSWCNSLSLLIISSLVRSDVLLTVSSLRSTYIPAALPRLISAVTAAPKALFESALSLNSSRLSRCLDSVSVALAAPLFCNSCIRRWTRGSLFARNAPALPAFLCE